MENGRLVAVVAASDDGVRLAKFLTASFPAAVPSGNQAKRCCAAVGRVRVNDGPPEGFKGAQRLRAGDRVALSFLGTTEFAPPSTEASELGAGVSLEGGGGG